jgi:uncharacterized Tic20 family protein
MDEIPDTSPTKDERNLAMLAHLLGIFSGFIGPLVIWLIKKDESAFIADQAREALNFQITIAIALFASIMLKVILIGVILVPIVFILNFIFCIVAAVSASKGKAYRYPYTLRLVT